MDLSGKIALITGSGTAIVDISGAAINNIAKR